MRAFPLLLAAIGVAACRSGTGAATAAGTDARTERATAAARASGERRTEQCVVRRVADGDTLTCADGTRVRLIGIDSPERSQAEGFASARAALLRLAPIGDAVRLERDVVPTDQYGRRLAWVWSGDRLLNEVLVRDGWAVLYTVPPNVRYTERIALAQRQARAASAGLWATNGFDCLPRDRRRGNC